MTIVFVEKVIVLNKEVSKTPLESIEKFKKENPQYQSQKMCYAGRLDPMAEGLLLILIGDECKKRKEYERLPKTYEFKVLFGIDTDTFDLMGKIQNRKLSKVSKKRIVEVTKKYQGEFLQEYPSYSSPRVEGKPLFWWAREGRLGEIKIPKKRIKIYELRFMNGDVISSKQLLKTVHERIEKVKGEFRQKEILEIWDEKLKNLKLEFPMVRFKISCSSGTYVRSIASEIGKDLQVPALAFSIKRTQIGKLKIRKEDVDKS